MTCKIIFKKVIEARLQLNTRRAITESFFPPISSLGNTRRRRSTEHDKADNRTQRLSGKVAALAAGTGLMPGEQIKDAAYNAVSVFSLCGSTEDLERELKQVTKQQKTQHQSFQTVQDQNIEKVTLPRDEIPLTQESVEQQKEDTYTHISYMLDRMYTLEDAFRCHKLESAYYLFLQNSQF